MRNSLLRPRRRPDADGALTTAAPRPARTRAAPFACPAEAGATKGPALPAEVIGFRSRQKSTQRDQQDVIERITMREQQRAARSQLVVVDARIARLRQRAGQVGR